MTDSEALARLSLALGEPDPTPMNRRAEWETCKVCRAWVSPTMTPSDAVTLCDRGPAKGHTKKTGFMDGIPATPGCPYRPRNSFAGGGR